MAALRRCGQPGCPELTPTRHCTTHTREHDRARGTRTQRGYNYQHDKLRAQYARDIQHGRTLHCHRCGEPIVNTDDLHLGHSDDRKRHEGPEHKLCNLREAGRKSHRQGR